MKIFFIIYEDKVFLKVHNNNFLFDFFDVLKYKSFIELCNRFCLIFSFQLMIKSIDLYEKKIKSIDLIFIDIILISGFLCKGLLFFC